MICYKIKMVDRSIIQCNEFYDSMVVTKLLKAPGMPDQVLQLLTKVSKHRYTQSVDYVVRPGKVRMTGRPSSGRGLTLQSLPSTYRRLLCGTLYRDIDMENALPRVMLTELQARELPSDNLKEYVNKRAAILKEIHENRDTAKQTIIRAMNLGNLSSDVHPLLKGLQSEMRGLLNDLKASDDPDDQELVSSAKKHAKKHMKDSKACILSRLYFRAETEIMRVVHDTFTKNGFEVGAIVFDGTMVRADPDDDLSEIILEAETSVYDQLGYTIKLVQKPMKATEEDLTILEQPTELSDKKQIRFREICLEVASRLKLIRYNGHVYKPHQTVPGAYIKFLKFEEYINFSCTTVSQDPIWIIQGVMSHVLEWIKGTGHPDFQLVTDDSWRNDVALFQDGWWDLNDLTFHQDDPEPPLGVFIFEESFFESKKKSTPNFYRLLMTQLANDVENPNEDEVQTYKIILALFGRLFYPVGFDHWQVVPFLLGEGNTGKGTVLRILISMFESSRVASMSAASRQSFQLQSLVKKQVIVFQDIPGELQGILPDTVFTTLVSGELIDIATMYDGIGETVQWNTPMIMAGNQTPQDYHDSGGRISRRMVVLPFSRTIPEADFDTTLESQIIERERASLFIKMVRCYHKIRKQVGKGKLSSIYTQILLDSQEEARLGLSPLYDFIKNGSTRYRIEHDPGESVLLSDLKRCFSNYCKFEAHIPFGPNWNSPGVSIQRAGFGYKRVNLCGKCNKEATKANCGDHYDSKTRGRKYIVNGMNIIDIVKEKDEGKENSFDDFGFRVRKRQSPEPTERVDIPKRRKQ